MARIAYSLIKNTHSLFSNVYSLISNACSLIALWKSKLKFRTIKFTDELLDTSEAKMKFGLYKTKSVLVKGSLAGFIVAALVWLSVFMYLAVYFKYVPSLEHVRPIHLKFGETYYAQEGGKHPYLTGHVQLTNRQQLLTMGQPYMIHLELEVPESPINRELGMFMVCADFRSKKRETIAHSCRLAMLHYKSRLIDILHTVAHSPCLIFGTIEEKQTLRVELFSEYEEALGPAVTDVFIEVRSNDVEVYSATLFINADLSGFRYIMFHWPILSGFIGITVNLLFVSIICVRTWYQLIESEEYRKYTEDKRRLELDQIGDKCE